MKSTFWMTAQETEAVITIPVEGTMQIKMLPARAKLTLPDGSEGLLHLHSRMRKTT